MKAAIGAILLTCLLLRDAAVADPVMHVLVQLPLLAVAGWLAARLSHRRPQAPEAALIVALSAVAFWMLPRSIDSALTSPAMEIVKFVSIPLLVGVPLGLAWGALHPLLRGFVKAQTISMLGVLGFLYTHAPVRICNSYLVSDQERLGVAFLMVAGALAILWSWPILVGRPLSGNDLEPRNAS